MEQLHQERQFSLKFRSHSMTAELNAFGPREVFSCKVVEWGWEYLKGREQTHFKISISPPVISSARHSVTGASRVYIMPVPSRYFAASGSSEVKFLSRYSSAATPEACHASTATRGRPRTCLRGGAGRALPGAVPPERGGPTTAAGPTGVARGSEGESEGWGGAGPARGRPTGGAARGPGHREKRGEGDGRENGAQARKAREER